MTRHKQRLLRMAWGDGKYTLTPMQKVAQAVFLRAGEDFTRRFPQKADRKGMDRLRLILEAGDFLLNTRSLRRKFWLNLLPEGMRLEHVYWPWKARLEAAEKLWASWAEFRLKKPSTRKRPVVKSLEEKSCE